MAVVDRDRGFIYVHIHRTGGNSVRQLLKASHNPKDEYQGWHSCARDVRTSMEKNNDGKFWQDAFKFSFVRNPFDWWVSLWLYVTKFAPGHRDHQTCKDMSLLKYLQWVIDVPMKWERPTGSNKYLDLRGFVCDEYDDVLVDYLGWYESLDSDMEEICEVLNIPFKGVPRENVNMHRKQRDYRKYYNAETRKFVEKHFADDLEVFGYEF